MRLKVGDLVIAAGVACTALALLFTLSPRQSGGDIVAVITQNNAELYRIELSTLNAPETLAIDDAYHLTIEAERGRIRVEKSDCPDQVCVETGWISLPGQVSACVPAGVVIRIEGSAASDLDVILK